MIRGRHERRKLGVPTTRTLQLILTSRDNETGRQNVSIPSIFLLTTRTEPSIRFYLKTNGRVPICELKGPRDGFNMLNREEAQLVGETSQSAAMQDSATRSMTGLAVPELRREVLALTDPNVFRASVHRTGFL